MTITFAQSWIEEGIAIGKAEGKKEAALTVLESRFGAVPVGIQKKLVKLQDMNHVEKMVKLASTCQSLKEFRKAL